MIAPLIVHTLSQFALGPRYVVNGLTVSACAGAAYPTANLALYIPVWLPAPMTVAQFVTYNGATASGNIDVGLYTADGTRLVSSGSTAQAGTSVLQVFNTTDIRVGPGLYYLAVAMDNTTGTLFRSSQGSRFFAGAGVLQQATAFALPATATFAAMTAAFLPVIGFTSRSFV